MLGWTPSISNSRASTQQVDEDTYASRIMWNCFMRKQLLVISQGEPLSATASKSIIFLLRFWNCFTKISSSMQMCADHHNKTKQFAMYVSVLIRMYKWFLLRTAMLIPDSPTLQPHQRIGLWAMCFMIVLMMLGCIWSMSNRVAPDGTVIRWWQQVCTPGRSLCA